MRKSRFMGVGLAFALAFTMGLDAQLASAQEPPEAPSPEAPATEGPVMLNQIEILSDTSSEGPTGRPLPPPPSVPNAMPPAAEPRVARPAQRRPAQQRPAVQHSMVQVGAFTDQTIVENVTAQLAALGLPVLWATQTQGNGTQVRLVAVGPYVTPAELDAALQAVRRAGFGEAFTR